MVSSLLPQTVVNPFFEEVSTYLKEDLEGVHHKICTNLSQLPLINKIAHHLAKPKGKRIRPIVALLCARLSNYQGTHHIDLAASIELIHMATLLHDDVIDQGAYRRNLPCAHTIWGNQATILGGDYLFSYAFHMISHLNSLPILKSLSEAAVAIAEGEVLQLSMVGNFSMTQETYFKIIRLKTASLFSAACAMGSFLGNGTHHTVLATYGLELGILFQLVDDLLDYHSDKNKIGKTIYSDLKEKKMTLPLLWLYEQCNDPEQAFLRQMVEAPKLTSSAVNKVTQLMESYKIYSQLKTFIKQQCLKTLTILEPLPSSQEKSFLKGVANFCAERIYQ